MFYRMGDGFQAYCKPCRKIIDQEYFARTREIRYEQVRARRQQLAKWVEQIKTSQACADRGVVYHPAAMTFDHLPGTEKVDNVSDLVRRGQKKLAQLEILKCEIVCANCHAIRTYDRRRAKNGLAEEPGFYAFPSIGDFSGSATGRAAA